MYAVVSFAVAVNFADAAAAALEVELLILEQEVTGIAEEEASEQSVVADKASPTSEKPQLLTHSEELRCHLSTWLQHLAEELESALELGMFEAAVVQYEEHPGEVEAPSHSHWVYSAKVKVVSVLLQRASGLAAQRWVDCCETLEALVGVLAFVV